MSGLFALAAVPAGLAGLFDYWIARHASDKVARSVVVASLAPPVILLVVCAVRLVRGIETQDRQYFGADMVFALSVILTLLWFAAAWIGFREGRAARSIALSAASAE